MSYFSHGRTCALRLKSSCRTSHTRRYCFSSSLSRRCVTAVITARENPPTTVGSTRYVQLIQYSFPAFAAAGSKLSFSVTYSTDTENTSPVITTHEWLRKNYRVRLYKCYVVDCKEALCIGNLCTRDECVERRRFVKKDFVKTFQRVGNNLRRADDVSSRSRERE